MVQVFMTLDGRVSSIMCGRGTVWGVFHSDLASDVLTGYMMDRPIPVHENGVVTSN